jgi:hypothetical protein
MSEIRGVRGRQRHYVRPAGIDRMVITSDGQSNVTTDVSKGEVLQALAALAVHPRLRGCVMEDPCCYPGLPHR